MDKDIDYINYIVIPQLKEMRDKKEETLKDKTLTDKQIEQRCKILIDRYKFLMEQWNIQFI